MRPMSTIRKWHFEQLRNNLATARYILQTAEPESLTLYRDSGDGWTVAEVIGHLLDCERLFLERAKLTVTQDCPELPFPDQNEDVIKGNYNACDPMDTFTKWEQVRHDYVDYLSTVGEEDWSREGRHPIYPPPLSLNDQLFLASWHDTLHFEQITRILTEKQTA